MVDGSKTFDPYGVWLMIEPGPRPPDARRLLGVGDAATAEEIEKCARARLEKLGHFAQHPDAGKREMCGRLMQEVREAYEGLVPAEARRALPAVTPVVVPVVARRPSPAPMARSGPLGMGRLRGGMSDEIRRRWMLLALGAAIVVVMFSLPFLIWRRGGATEGEKVQGVPSALTRPVR